MSKTLVFVSDFHIGPEHRNDHFDSQKEFVQFLDALDKQNQGVELILLGDIFCYVREISEKNPMATLMKSPLYRAFFKRLRKFASKHDVYLIVGNHDASAVWNKEIQESLKSLNIKFYKGQMLYYDCLFSYDGKKFKVYAEHGNQFEGVSSFRDITNPLDKPVSHVLQTFFINRVEDFAYRTRNQWLKDISIVKPIERVFNWFYSKYFYNELNRILRLIIAPILAGSLIAKIALLLVIMYFIYLRKYISISPVIWPVFLLIMIFLLIDFSFFIVLIVANFIKRDFRKKWRHYDISFKLNLNKSLWETTNKNIVAVLNNNGRAMYGDTKNTDLFVLGHYHEPRLEIIKAGRLLKGWADIGSWRKDLLRVPARFKLPAVYMPLYQLTYLKVWQEKDRVMAELRERQKKFKPQLTLMERIASFRRWSPTRFNGKDALLKRAVFMMR